MKRLLLINPSSENEIQSPLPYFVSEGKGVTPPLGILSIAAQAMQNTDYTTMLIDVQVEGLSYESLANKISQFNPDIIGITAMSMTVRDAYKTIQMSKKICPNSKIVVGGPHVNCYPLETAAWKDVDYAIHGEGEIVFGEFLREFSNRGYASGLKGVIYKDSDGVIENNERADYIKDLNSLPIPDRTILPYKKYSSIIMKKSPVTSILSSRGCPFRCNYCDRPSVGKAFRPRSVESVIHELKICNDIGIKSFLFYDDTFTVNRKRVIDFCIAITDSKLDIEFNIRSRVDTVDEEMLYYLKKAGCLGIQYGVESGSQTILDRMNKGITLQQIHDTVKITKKHNILTTAYFMFGNPGETRQDIKLTHEFMELIDPDYVMISIFTPYPKTKSYEEGIKRNLFEDVWKKLAEDPTIEFEMPVWTENFTTGELNKMLTDTYRKYYFSGKRILRQISSIKSIRELREKAKAAVKILKNRH
ncbi:B12-binding domain-containing radical SAM protein [Candidatus Magnetominusculus xianensis]|uniref:Radical SAM protein n=1 Tax=Candidatus Magnetominusculus xianensis TaxID=1748249 RepID=A0ABR5SL03_9BACT|nr:radical SAM protein [Candidatus Magnetominusculus xianensis]KWT90138.1 radical SAM protein [Candidatus Magnetominusculus xianensis]MBF0403632.1 radical SAM protein [Nitrospirota bacterium]